MGIDIHEVIAEMFRNPHDDDNKARVDAKIAEIQSHYPDSDEIMKVGWTEYTRAELREMLEVTLERFYETRRKQILDNYDVIDVEKDFQFEHNGDIYGGTIDLVIRRKMDGKLCLLDWKSISKQIQEGYLELNTQKYMYAVACSVLYGEYPSTFYVGGVLKRKIRYPTVLKNGTISCSDSTLKDCTYDSFMSVIRSNELSEEPYAEILAKLKEKDSYDIVNLFPLEHLDLTEKMIINGWDRIVQLKRLWQFSVESDAWPKCDGMSCSMCKNTYQKLCVAEEMGADIEEVLLDDYVVRAPNDRAEAWDL